MTKLCQMTDPASRQRGRLTGTKTVRLKTETVKQ
jgi:hypothetical protein